MRTQSTESNLKRRYAMLGRKHKEESINKMRGRIFSEEHRRKIGLSKVGNKYFLGMKHTPEAKFKISQTHKGRSLSGEHKLKLSLINKGKTASQETRRKLSQRFKGERSHLWKGGVTSHHDKIRKSLDYSLWRESVFERDKYKCVLCGDNRGGNLNADHIKPFALFPDLRFEVSNGRTLCIKCHKQTSTWGSRSRNYKSYIKYNEIKASTTR